MSKRLSPTRRLFNKYTELQEQMHVLVTHDGSEEAKVKLSRVERRFWPIQEELLRRLDERDELVAAVRPAWINQSERPETLLETCQRQATKIDECESALRLALAGTEQHYFGSPARIDDVRAALAEAQARIAALTTKAQDWDSWCAFLDANDGNPQARLVAHDWLVAARARSVAGC